MKVAVPNLRIMSLKNPDELKRGHSLYPGNPQFVTSPSEMDPAEFKVLIERFVVGINERAPSIEVRECGEGLLDLATIPGLRIQIPNGHSSCVRASVFGKLQTVHEQLAKLGYGLVLMDALRPISVQLRYLEMAKGNLRKEYPTLEAEDPKRFNILVTKMIATPDFAPHCTGGAVDISVYNLETGENLDFGSRYLEDLGSPVIMTDYPSITGVARQNRDMLRNLMVAQGFWSYPGEWWHYSYGDKAQASAQGLPYAIYGALPQE